MTKRQAKIAVIGMIGKSVFMEVDQFHKGGETVVAKSCHEDWGGKGFNQAVAAARQGAAVAFLGACAEKDRPSIASDLAGERGLTLRLIGRPVNSALATIITDAEGTTRVTCCAGAELEVADVDAFADEIVAADLLLLSNEVPEEVNLRASEIAAAHGVEIILNPAPARPLPEALKSRVFLFTPNEFETAGLEDAGGEVVTTLGGAGCKIRSTGEVVPPVCCGKVLDTTGAGDTFNGVLAVRIAEGEPIADACRAANAAAGKGVTVRYVLPSIPYREGFTKE